MREDLRALLGWSGGSFIPSTLSHRSRRNIVTCRTLFGRRTHWIEARGAYRVITVALLVLLSSFLWWFPERKILFNICNKTGVDDWNRLRTYSSFEEIHLPRLWGFSALHIKDLSRKMGKTNQPLLWIATIYKTSNLVVKWIMHIDNHKVSKQINHGPVFFLNNTPLRSWISLESVSVAA